VDTTEPGRATPNVAALAVREIRPDDADRLTRFHRTLSLETTRLRFFSPHPRLSPDELLRFTTVDHWDREALVVLDGDDIVAVGRYDRMDVSEVAEVAFVVSDPWQGKGIGPLLLTRLADLARRRGIDRLVALVLPENDRMLEMLRHTPFPARRRFADGVMQVELVIDEEDGNGGAGGSTPVR
jgi:GNAT superfamily N-acetyltransferase